MGRVREGPAHIICALTSSAPALLIFMRRVICALGLVSIAFVRPAQAQLRAIETPELRLVYFDPTETFLVPYVARTFLNSLAFQRRLFRFDPKHRVTVLLVDFQDAGN